MKNNIKIEKYFGQDIQKVFKDFVNLRITVFHEYPYLYIGSDEFEADIIQSYVECSKCLAVVARDLTNNKVVGIAVGLPLSTRSETLRRVLVEKKYDTDKMFYLAEELIYKEYRGLGLGKLMNDEIEEYARSLKIYNTITLCTVERPQNHPRRPRDYIDIDGFWEAMGYIKRLELKTESAYPDIDDQLLPEKTIDGALIETPKPMYFWTKPCR